MCCSLGAMNWRDPRSLQKNIKGGQWQGILEKVRRLCPWKVIIILLTTPWELDNFHRFCNLVSMLNYFVSSFYLEYAIFRAFIWLHDQWSSIFRHTCWWTCGWHYFDILIFSICLFEKIMTNQFSYWSSHFSSLMKNKRQTTEKRGNLQYKRVEWLLGWLKYILSEEKKKFLDSYFWPPLQTQGFLNLDLELNLRTEWFISIGMC